MASQCPMCLRDYKSLAQHLQKGSRLDRHLNSHTELSSAAKRKLLERLKRWLTLATLGRLRATNPTVPMVSRLDLDPAEEQLSPPPPQTLEASPSSSFRSTEFPDHVTVLNCLLEDFKVLQEGPDPSPKLKNNVQSKLHRIRKFVGWMSRGKTDLGKLQFLGDLDNLRGWVKSLRGNKMALPTTLHYLKNVRQFVVFIGETPPPSSRLSQKNVLMVVRELKASIRSWTRPVVLHQMRVKGKKDATIHSIKELQECRRLALVAIPKLLSRLEEQHTTTDQCNLFGYVAAYLASLYGHRLGVFLNMTDVQVSQAVHGPEKNDYLLKMEDHKTNESFGTAKMLLSDQEYGWLMDIIHLKTKWANGKKMSKYVFFNTTFSPDKNLTKYVKRVWSEMHLKGEATFTSLRSAVATFARDRHGEDSQDRKSMARLMCHDTATSDKFYTMDLTMEQARKGCLLFEEAQKEGEESVTGTNKRKKDGEEGRKKKTKQESTPPQSDVIKRQESCIVTNL
ncbi:Hydroxycinnamoyltransferase 2 [Dissostichus eleginoides]|uniref:Hydroxycinnamoyltransferase 2 n=1 Tax=Dissostichus eleginoides TaxID=100907 RepID=A0AAD9B387_DISEL|nr:Hydroxycinnamoyltransferase 2 [Dissostichus eleginoides]